MCRSTRPFRPSGLRFVLEDAGASVVLTQAALTKDWSFGDARVVQLDGDWELIARGETARPEQHRRTRRSGLCHLHIRVDGQAKGVEVPHRAVVNLLQSMLVQPGLAKTDVLAAVTTLSFDISGLELFLPLCVGAKLAIVSRETAQYAVQLLRVFEGCQCYSRAGYAGHVAAIAGSRLGGEPALKVLCGGEAFPRELANELVKRASVGVEHVWADRNHDLVSACWK